MEERCLLSECWVKKTYSSKVPVNASKYYNIWIPAGEILEVRNRLHK